MNSGDKFLGGRKIDPHRIIFIHGNMSRAQSNLKKTRNEFFSPSAAIAPSNPKEGIFLSPSARNNILRRFTRLVLAKNLMCAQIPLTELSISGIELYVL